MRSVLVVLLGSQEELRRVVLCWLNHLLSPMWFESWLLHFKSSSLLMCLGKHWERDCQGVQGLPWPDPALPVVAMWGVKQCLEDLSLCLSQHFSNKKAFLKTRTNVLYTILNFVSKFKVSGVRLKIILRFPQL